MAKRKKLIGYSINIPFTNKNNMNLIFDTEKDLFSKGITFDTGSDFKSRDWELDTLPMKKIRIALQTLKSKKIKFTKQPIYN